MKLADPLPKFDPEIVMQMPILWTVSEKSGLKLGAVGSIMIEQPSMNSLVIHCH